MRAFALAVIPTFPLFLVALSLATPVSASALISRNQVCANAPNVIAGKPFNRRAALPPSPLHLPRKSTKTILWCAQGTTTYIILTMSDHLVPAVFIDDLLQSSYAAVSHYLDTIGDGLVVGGTFIWQGSGGLYLRTDNTNNHQQTYGVLAAALRALQDYMHAGGVGFGAAWFHIFDGGVEVGMGAIG